MEDRPREGDCGKCLCKKCHYAPTFCKLAHCDNCTVLDEKRTCVGFVKAKRVEELGV